jgi:hypothetical protein
VFAGFVRLPWQWSLRSCLLYFSMCLVQAAASGHIRVALQEPLQLSLQCGVTGGCILAPDRMAAERLEWQQRAWCALQLGTLSVVAASTFECFGWHFASVSANCARLLFGMAAGYVHSVGCAPRRLVPLCVDLHGTCSHVPFTATCVLACGSD